MTGGAGKINESANSMIANQKSKSSTNRGIYRSGKKEKKMKGWISSPESYQMIWIQHHCIQQFDGKLLPL